MWDFYSLYSCQFSPLPFPEDGSILFSCPIYRKYGGIVKWRHKEGAGSVAEVVVYIPYPELPISKVSFYQPPHCKEFEPFFFHLSHTTTRLGHEHLPGK